MSWVDLPYAAEALAECAFLMEHHRLNGEADTRQTERNRQAALKQIEIPENAMRVGPGTDAVVWKICAD
jgi:hypothetical protein